ncbi:MAG: hypothetical protein B7Z80_14945, partial [Rhodospirillales bacterium 20-64-7]
MLAGSLLPRPVLAQAASEVSPLVPGTLKKPIFDTVTPVYKTAKKPGSTATTVVAEVDGRAVTLGDVGDAIAELPPTVQALPLMTLFPRIVDELVRRQALDIRAHQQGIDEKPAVRRKIQAATDKVLADEFLRSDALRPVTEAALLARYTQEIAGKPGPDQVRTRIIMVPTEQEARSIIAELHAGTDFATLARQVSKDTTAPAGGDLGYLARDGLNPEIGAVAFALRPGDVSPYPVSSMDAWFVIKVEDRRQGKAATYQEIAPQLARQMAQQIYAEQVQKFAEKYELSFPLAGDPDRDAHG